MMRYLITGGAGFIGCNVANHYLARGASVTIFDDFSRLGSRENVLWLQRQYPDGVTVVEGDVLDRPAITRAVWDTDVVFHLAGQVAVTTSMSDPLRDCLSNVVGTVNVLEAARQVDSPPIVLFSSTNKVYGDLPGRLTETATRYVVADGYNGVSEEYSVVPRSPYGCSKCAADQYVVDYANTYGLQTVVFRQSCIYGERQFGIEEQGWVAWFALRAMQRQPVTIYGDGKQVRDVLYVSDLVDAFDCAIRNISRTSGQVYNIGGGPQNTISVCELLATLRERFGDFRCDVAAWRPGDQRVYISDIAKAKRDFGWTPRTSVVDGMCRLLKWLASNQRVTSLSLSS